MKYPLESGAQACLTIEHRSVESEVWHDSFILVPEEVAISNAPDLVPSLPMAAAMGLMMAAYERLVLTPAKLGSKIQEERWIKDLLFTDKARRLVAQLKEILKVPSDDRVVVKSIQEILNDFDNAAKGTWNPIEFRSGWAEDKFKANWAILQSWKGWDQKRLSVNQRKEAFRALGFQISSHQAFRKRLIYLLLIDTKIRSTVPLPRPLL